PSYQGEFVSFDGIQFEPKPVQRPHPPLWFGGDSPAALRRVARAGNGWAPWLTTRETLPSRLEELRRLPGYGEGGAIDVRLPPAPPRAAQYDQPSSPDEELANPFSSPQQVIDAIGALGDAGVTWTSIPRPGPPAASLTDHLEHLAWGAETVMPLF